MKAISTALKTHLAGSVTSICTCWKITRVDGTVFAFTDHDQNLEVLGVNYQAAAGYTRSAISSDLTMKVDNLQIVGLLDNAAITEQDMRAGLFDFAGVEIFLVNWADLTMGQLNLRSGWFGEVVILPTGVFQTEIRGLMNALVMNVGEYFTPLCRANLGDSQCQMPIAPGPWQPDIAVTIGTYVSDPSATDALHQLAIYLCEVAGTTGATQPTFNPTIGVTTTETTGVQWYSNAPMRGVGTVVSSTSNSSAVVSGMVPGVTASGTIATITITGNIYDNMGIELTINGVTNSWPLSYGINSTLAVETLTGDINAAAMGATATNSFTVDNVHSCIISLTDPTSTANVTKSGDPDNVVQITNFTGASGTGSPYFQGGLVSWVSGANAGLSMEMKSWTAGSGTQGTLQLFLAMPFAIQAGDEFYFAPGCDKTRSTCFYRFNNMLNFRGEPDLPGIDALLQTGATV